MGRRAQGHTVNPFIPEIRYRQRKGAGTSAKRTRGITSGNRKRRRPLKEFCRTLPETEPATFHTFHVSKNPILKREQHEA
ncbi:hypothetical protein NPIL_687861, partial [Nephila pilipes]